MNFSYLPGDAKLFALVSLANFESLMREKYILNWSEKSVSMDFLCVSTLVAEERSYECNFHCENKDDVIS